MLGNNPNDIIRAISDVDRARVKGHNELAKIVNHLSTEQAKVQQQAQIDAIKEIVTHTYSSGVNYTNIIIVAGYAAFFTVWKSMKTDLSKIIMLSSCLSVSISVILFILSEIHKMISTTMFNKGFFSNIESDLPPTFIDDYRKKAQSHERKMFRTWLIYFLPTLVFGLLGGGLLLYAFSSSLIREIISVFQNSV